MFLARFLKDTATRCISKVLPKLAGDQKCFRAFEKAGYHVTPNHYYYPIPDLSSLSDDLWEKESAIVGVDMNITQQLGLLQEVFPQFRSEFNFPITKTSNLPYEYYLKNDTFGGGGDSEVLHCMIRHFKPKKIVEIGSGFSTYISARACLMNKDKDGVNTELVCVEPYPNETLKRGFPV